ncbi:MAG: nucleotidyltransferase family protein [Acidimicrobiales bacterium]
MDRTTTAAIVLAAGEATRFDQATHKLDAEIGGRTLLARALTAALDSAVGPVLVVVAGAGGRPLTTPIPESVVTVTNDAWRDGSASSLRTGVTAAAELGADRVVVALGDQPFIDTAAWRAVAADDGPIAVATYSGRRGHPVLLRSDIWHLLPERGDEGARALMRLRPDLVREVPCQGSSVDIDTVEDLRRWQNSSSTSSP